MIVLGIESTAHTFAASIVDYKNKKVLSNERCLFTTKEGGMIPGKVADHHVENCDKIINNAITKSKIKEEQIDLISFSQGPGFGHTLRIGAVSARILAIKYDKPIVGVNHCVAHLEIGRVLT